MKDLTAEEKITRDTYDSHAKEWSQTHFTPGFWASELNFFKTLLPGGRVLDIGCGAGRAFEEISQLGYEYVGIDISEGLLKEARQVNPDAVFLNQSVYETEFADNYFDGFWACASLLHIPRAKISDALREISRILRSGGVGFISIKEGTGEGILDSKTRSGDTYSRFFAKYSLEEFKDILSNSNYHIISFGQKPVNEHLVWLTYFVRIK